MKTIFHVGLISCFLLLLIILFPATSFSATFCVSNATELQSALSTAESNGEDNTIKIVQGTYNGNFVYASTEAYTLTVEGGYTQGCASRTIDPANTILDGGEIDTVLALVSQGAANFSMEGLTLRNGSASTVSDGGGLYAKTEGKVTLTNNIFSGNTAEAGGSSYGGGAYIGGSIATLTNNTFTGNTAIYYLPRWGGANGGGAYVSGGGTLTNNTFTENIAIQGRGGGSFGGSTLTDNTFTGNTANDSGGGAAGGRTLTNNTFTGNTTNDSGGGAAGGRTLISNTFIENTAKDSGGGATVAGEGTLSNNIFTGNTASSGSGGGTHVNSGTLTNNTFTKNTANSGGGIYAVGMNIAATNNTISENTASGQGGGIWAKFTNSSYTGKLYNNILWNNTAPEAGDLYIDNTGNDPFFPVTVNLFNNDFDQSTSGAYISKPFTIDPSNLDNADPLFVGGGNYHLTALSPCINTGDNNAPDLPTTDKDGNPRIMGGIVDMGAYEYQPVAYVNKDDETCGGKTPCYTAIQEAINASGDGTVINIVEGNYEEDITLNVSKTLTLKGGYDSDFTTQLSNTTIKGSLVVSAGKLKTSKIKVHFQK